MEKTKPSNEIKSHPNIRDWIDRIDKIRKDNPNFTLRQAMILDKLNNPNKYPYEYE